MDCKHHPVPEWVDALRVRFPLDREMDAVLARKLRLRPGPAYEPVSQARLVEGLRALIEHAEGKPVTIEQPHWLAGGASKIQLAFRLGGSDGRRCVLRMEPAASVVETSRRQEFELLSAIEGVVPAPQALWLDADARFLPYPALVYSFVEGVTKPPDVTANVSNLGIDRRSRRSSSSVSHAFIPGTGVRPRCPRSNDPNRRMRRSSGSSTNGSASGTRTAVRKSR